MVQGHSVFEPGRFAGHAFCPESKTICLRSIATKTTQAFAVPKDAPPVKREFEPDPRPEATLQARSCRTRRATGCHPGPVLLASTSGAGAASEDDPRDDRFAWAVLEGSQASAVAASGNNVYFGGSF